MQHEAERTVCAGGPKEGHAGGRGNGRPARREGDCAKRLLLKSGVGWGLSTH